MIRSVLYFTPKQGHEAIVDFFRRHRVLERAAEVEGFVASELHVPADGPGPVLVTALWRDAEAYERWLGSPERAENVDELAELVDDELHAQARGDVYEVVLAAGPSGKSDGIPA